MREEEHNLQVACYKWFEDTFGILGPMLFAVPNGGARSRITGAKLKAEGVTAGVADLLLLIPNAHHHSLAIEMKTKAGRQSPAQKSWQKVAEYHGVKYVVVNSKEQFKREIYEYLNDK